MAGKYFGTDGIRDEANTGNLTVAKIVRVAQSLGVILQAQADSGGDRAGKPKVGIAADTRISKDMIRSALCAGLNSMGVNAIDFGVLPTPGLAYLTPKRSLDLGIMISASHNPMEDNGIKVFGSDGGKLSGDLEYLLEEQIDCGELRTDLFLGGKVGTVRSDPTGIDEYVSSLVNAFDPHMLKNTTVALDCANGATWKAAPEVFSRLGARINVMANAPTGTNINEKCGSVHPGALCELVTTEKCDIGVALDGDGDRSIFVDSRGDVVNGDAVMASLGIRMKEKGTLAHDTVIATVMSNIGLDVALREHGIGLERTPVGDRHVTERLRSGGFSLGGEQSGHIIFGSEINYTGDGIFTSLKMLEAMVETGRPVHEMTGTMRNYPQVLINVPVTRKPPVEELHEVLARVKEAEEDLGDEGRVVLRYSGTEKKMRVMTEGPDSTMVERLAESIADAVRAEIG